MEIQREIHVLPLLKPFAISRTVFHDAKVIRVKVTEGSHTGMAECVPQARFGESIESVIEQLDFATQMASRSPLNRALIQGLLPGGAARNAIDCALWDMDAKLERKPAWALAGLEPPISIPTAYTLPLSPPDQARLEAEKHQHRPLLKVKVGTHDDATRLENIRAGAPNARIIADANEAWTIEQLDAMAPILESVGVEMVEQPLPADKDDALYERSYPFAICADESCRGSYSIPSLIGKYDVISIKLDKVGGLTEALALRRAAEHAHFRIMVGCGIGSSLAIAPAILVAQGAAFVDLDGPLFLREDIPGGVQYSDGHVGIADSRLWG